MVTIRMDGANKNALSRSMMTWITAQLREAGGRPVLLTGSADVFCAGLDLSEVLALDAVTCMDFLDLLEEMLFTLFHYPGPTVALVNGHAIAGGAVLTLCCDHRVAADAPRAKIGLNEVAIGLSFPPNTLNIVRARVPERHLERVVLGAELVAPRVACARGLIDEVSDDAAATAAARLEALATLPASAYAATKRDLRGHVVRRPLDAWPHFRTDVLPAWTSDGLRARIQAILKR